VQNSGQRDANKRDHCDPVTIVQPARGKAPAFSHLGKAAVGAGPSLSFAGVDEVGRGAWAGPLPVGVVVIGPQSSVSHPVGTARFEATRRGGERASLRSSVRWCTSWAVATPGRRVRQLGMTASLRRPPGAPSSNLPAESFPSVILDGNLTM